MVVPRLILWELVLIQLFTVRSIMLTFNWRIMYVLYSLAMQNSLFSTALTPICARSRSRNAAKSVDRGENRYPRSSTPLRDVNTSSGTKVQQIVQKKKSSGTGRSADKPGRKRKSSTAVTGLREKVAKRQVSTASTGKNCSLMSNTISGRSRVINSLAGELQHQKHEVFGVCVS